MACMQPAVSLKCPNCASPLKTEDWDQERGLAKCSYCRSLVSMPSPGRTILFRPRPQMPMPKGTTVAETGGGVVITRRWFSIVVFFLVPFCIVWDGFLITWYALSGSAPLFAKLFPILHVAVGVGLTYLTLAMIINRTWIKADNGVVSILHGPLPWTGNLVIPCSEIDQLFCREIIRHGKNGPSVSYELWAALRDGMTRKLLSTMLTEEQAIFIEQRLEKALGITDRAMPGELHR